MRPRSQTLHESRHHSAFLAKSADGRHFAWSRHRCTRSSNGTCMTTPALGEHRPAGGRRLQSFGIIAGAHAEHVARDVAHAIDVGDVRSRAYDPRTIAPALSRPDVLVSLQPARPAPEASIRASEPQRTVATPRQTSGSSGLKFLRTRPRSSHPQHGMSEEGSSRAAVSPHRSRHERAARRFRRAGTTENGHPRQRGAPYRKATTCQLRS